jgi:hypothetical protein
MPRLILEFRRISGDFSFVLATPGDRFIVVGGSKKLPASSPSPESSVGVGLRIPMSDGIEYRSGGLYCLGLCYRADSRFGICDTRSCSSKDVIPEKLEDNCFGICYTRSCSAISAAIPEKPENIEVIEQGVGVIEASLGTLERARAF